MMRSEEEENVSFELEAPAAPAESSSIGWLAAPAADSASTSGVIPGWLKLELPEDPRIAGLPAVSGPGTIRISRNTQRTAIVRRDDMQRDAESAAIANASSIPLNLLKQLNKIPLVYGLVAKVNLSRPAFQFKIEHDLPKNVRLVEVKPKASVVGDHIIWNFGRVDPGQELRLQIVIQPEDGAVLDPSEFASFHANYNQALHFQTPIVRPRLAGAVELPKRLSLGAWATLAVEVENIGNWPVRNTIARPALPSGLKFADGAPHTAELGLLLPSEKRRAEFRVRALQDGPQVVRVELGGSDGAACQIEHPVEVVSPQLELRIRGDERTRLKEEVEFQIDASNLGRAATDDYQIDLAYTRHLRVLNFEGGTIDAERRIITWVGHTIEPGERLRTPVRFAVEETGSAELSLAIRTVSGATDRATHALGIDFEYGDSPQIIDDYIAEGASDAEVAPAKDRAVRKSSEDAVQLVVFTLGRSDYAVPLERVLEVGTLPRYTPLPNVPDWLMGLTNIRGDVVSLVDLGTLLNREATADRPDRRALVVRDRDNRVQTSLVVDRVRGLRGFAADRIAPPKGAVRGPAAPYLSGLVHHEGRTVSVLDIDRLLASNEMRRFDGV